VKVEWAGRLAERADALQRPRPPRSQRAVTARGSGAWEQLAAIRGQAERAALTVRYLDGLPVAEVAACLGRSVRATETLLVRARAALRQVYREEGSRDA
jgi:DNA-directed RNA polymerase specialized sigma24 family protein